MASLIDLIDRLDSVDYPDRYPPACIYAEGGPDADPDAQALVCDGDEVGSTVCPQNPTLSYVLEVDLAKECVEGWSTGRGGRKPTPWDKFTAVMYYARHDSWLPLE